MRRNLIYNALLNRRNISPTTTPAPTTTGAPTTTIYLLPGEVLIGSQIWMDRNVDDNIPGSLVYQNNESKRAIYGGLYLWSHIPTIEALYPGYHVPTKDELYTLAASVGGTIAGGGKLKQAGTSLWTSPNTGATNETGFTALPGGIWREAFSDWALEGWYSTMWSKTERETDPTKAWWFQLYYMATNINIYYVDKDNTASIRLIKD